MPPSRSGGGSINCAEMPAISARNRRLQRAERSQRPRIGPHGRRWLDRSAAAPTRGREGRERSRQALDPGEMLLDEEVPQGCARPPKRASRVRGQNLVHRRERAQDQRSMRAQRGDIVPQRGEDREPTSNAAASASAATHLRSRQRTGACCWRACRPRSPRLAGWLVDVPRRLKCPK